MQEFIAAAVQIAPIPNDILANVEKACHWLREAALNHGANLVVFPEAATTGFNPGLPREALHALVDRVPGRTTSEVSRVAADLKVHVVWTTYERGETPGVVYNSAVLIGPDGSIIGIYRKTHLFPTERVEGGGWSTPGKRAPVFRTELARIGIMICYDGDFPELARSMAIKGAEVIARPSALLRSYDIWHLTNAARAYDNHVYIVGANAVGSDAGGDYYFGNSMIVSPIGWKLAQARGTEEIISQRLDPDPIKYMTVGSRAPMIFDHLQDRNIEAYEGILSPARSPFEPARRIEPEPR